MNYNQTYCTAALVSLTYAMKAQKALSAAGLHSDIVKLDSSRTRRGCAYGVQFRCEYSDNIRRVLQADGIGVRQYLEGGGETI